MLKNSSLTFEIRSTINLQSKKVTDRQPRLQTINLMPHKQLFKRKFLLKLKFYFKFRNLENFLNFKQWNFINVTNRQTRLHSNSSKPQNNSLNENSSRNFVFPQTCFSHRAGIKIENTQTKGSPRRTDRQISHCLSNMKNDIENENAKNKVLYVFERFPKLLYFTFIRY